MTISNNPAHFLIDIRSLLPMGFKLQSTQHRLNGGHCDLSIRLNDRIERWPNSTPFRTIDKAGRNSNLRYAGLAQQGDTLMTRSELQANQEYMWKALSVDQPTTLTLAVEMLMRCHLSPEQILTKTMTALDGSEHDA